MFGNSDPFENIRKVIQAPTHTMRTFQIDQPIDSHYRIATCQEVNCQAYAKGWRMGFDLTDPERRKAAQWIKNKSGKSFIYELTDIKVVFTFASEQSCFKKHRVPTGREPFYIVRGGDFRGNPERVRVVHRSADSFVDQWQTDLDKLNNVRERG